MAGGRIFWRMDPNATQPSNGGSLSCGQVGFTYTVRIRGVSSPAERAVNSTTKKRRRSPHEFRTRGNRGKVFSIFWERQRGWRLDVSRRCGISSHSRSEAMGNDPRPIDTAGLLRQIGWVRSLARSLVLDDEQAEDLVQETLLAALEGSNRTRARPRAWLAKVLRHCKSARERSERPASSGAATPASGASTG